MPRCKYDAFMISQIMVFLVVWGASWAIIVNLHKKSRVFLYSFNTLSLFKRYCILFLYQYNKDNKKKKEKPDGVKKKYIEW